MNKEHLTHLQISTLCFFLINSLFITIGYNYLSNISNNDTILDIIVGGSFIILLLIGILWLKRTNKNKSLLDLVDSTSYLKYFFYPIIILILGITIIYVLNISTSFISYYILKEVNVLIISITLIATILYVVNMGISTITKVSEIFFYIFILILIISWIGLINQIDFSNLRPLFTISINNHIKSSFTYFITSCIPLFLLLIIPECTIKSSKKDDKLPIYFTIGSVTLALSQFILIISVLGIHLTNIFENPDMIVYKKISFLNILDRVEVMLSFNNILNMFFILVMCFYVLKEIINHLIKTKKEHINLALIGLFSLILSNTIEITNHIYISSNFICFIIIIYLLLRNIIYKYSHH